MKGKLHTCLVVIAVIAVIAGGLGGMHYVHAAKDAKGLQVEIRKTETTRANASPAITLTVASETDEGTSRTEETEELSGEVAGIPYDRLVMANVMEAVNIREEPSEEAKIVGKLYKECGGEILENADGWTKVRSGKVTGYVKNDYLLFGEEAKQLADQVVNLVATSQTMTLRVRTEPNENSTVLGLLAEGDTIDAIEDQGDWIKAEYSDGTECYVASQFVSISSELPYGETIESIESREASRKALEAAAAKEMAGNKKESSGGSEGKKQEASGSKPSASLDPSSINDVQLLAALIQCEAGNECHEGQVAIGNVVMNRLRTGRFGSSIYSVIYANGQFGPAGSGKVAQVYASGPKATCMAAASEAISGVSYVGTATSFRSISSGHLGIVIGSHVFW
ncbi:MAG: cell wall hydrolase [Lachnospiraceae bacterium]|nr:cell wall hydrolase [Lachnospiraceae bacterium]